MANSTSARSRAKSRRPKFPLWLHSGACQWRKKIRGQHRYFGTDREKALAEYLRVRDDLQAGRTPPMVKKLGRNDEPWISGGFCVSEVRFWVGGTPAGQISVEASAPARGCVVLRANR